MEQYRKKPVVIEAIKFAKDNLIEVISFVEQKDKHTIVKSALAGGDRYLDWEESVIKGGFKIKTLEGEMTASVGDWIIKGIKGEFYPCKPDIFEATYEPATPAKAEQDGSRWVKLEDFKFNPWETVYARWNMDPFNTWRSCCYKSPDGILTWIGEKPRGDAQVYILHESTTPPIKEAGQPRNLPIEELIKLSDDELNDEIDKIRSRLGMGKREQSQQQPAGESATKEREIAFAEWIREQNYKPYAGWWYSNGNNFANQPISEQGLYDLWQQSQNNKP